MCVNITSPVRSKSPLQVFPARHWMHCLITQHLSYRKYNIVTSSPYMEQPGILQFLFNTNFRISLFVIYRDTETLLKTMNPDLSYVKLKIEQHRQFTPTKKWNLSLKVRLKFYPRGQFPLYYIYRIVKKASYRRNSPSTLKNTPAILIIFGSILSLEAGLKITVRSNTAVRSPVTMTGKTKFTSVISVALLRASSSKCTFFYLLFHSPQTISRWKMDYTL